MSLKHPDAPPGPTGDLAVQTVFTLEGDNIPRHELRDAELPPDVAYQIIHDELMLDGNARMNLATFVSTWMEPQAEKLMAECLDKNMIDKDEYPQTAELEMRCVNILSRLWHAPEATEAVGCSTTGSSEAAMLGGLALKRRWQHRRKAAGKPADRPNLVMGINVQVCELLGRRDAPRAHGGGPIPPLRRGGGEALRREHDRGRRHSRLDLRRILRARPGDL
jgi:glutamate decarboxylase